MENKKNKEMLELCIDVAKNYNTLKNGFYKSPTKEFCIIKTDLMSEGIDTPARIAHSTKILELSDKLEGWSYSEILYILVWCFSSRNGIVEYHKSDIIPINKLKDVDSFNLKEVFKRTMNILPYSNSNTKRLECMLEQIKKIEEIPKNLMDEYSQKMNNSIGQEWDIVHGFKITNHDNVPRKAIIGVFGYSNKVNYGSESGIEIKSKDGKEFGQFLKEIAAAPDFKVEAIDVWCKNKDQLKEPITLKTAEVGGNKGKVNHIIPDEDIRTSWYDVKYSHSNIHSLEILVMPNTTLTLNIVNNVRVMVESKNEDSNKEEKEDLGADIGNHYKSDVVDYLKEDDVDIETKGENSEFSVPIPDRLLKTPKNILENYLLGTILKSNKISKTPYHLKIKNKSEKTLTSNIFGFNEFFNKENENWGNPEGISIEKGTFDSYKDVLLQSAFKPFKTALIILKSDNKDQITQIITVSSVTGKGQTVTLPLITKSYYKDIPTSIPVNEINYELNINYQTKLQMPILPKTEVDVYIYHYNDKNSLIKELDKLKYKLEKLENKKWWHFFFPPKK